MPVKKETAKKRVVKKASPAAKKSAKPDLKEFLEGVRQKAYELYQDRLRQGVAGDEIADWFEAEKAIKEKYGL
ncbi:MAG TPA: hypothetical protein PKG72_07070 [Smithellaceae bacterium]|jgi:hypothetical protein|nr:hypothetical protein [Syntrophaceae bacterium]HNV57045.1 hypothetical protein [Smithellaceae bacterium]HNY96600.1 hypothetical protein [Smithellaceae bacterium]HOH57540.1 hypothetical protein [Smithellaceae bacterium]HPV72201.1 hypothetical protein [Smithellaceae bacterium]